MDQEARDRLLIETHGNVKKIEGKIEDWSERLTDVEAVATKALTKSEVNQKVAFLGGIPLIGALVGLVAKIVLS